MSDRDSQWHAAMAELRAVSEQMIEQYNRDREITRERGKARMVMYLVNAETALSRSRRKMPPWWRFIARRRYRRDIVLELDRIGRIACCDACVGTFAVYDMPCAIHQRDEAERDRAFEIVHAHRLAREAQP